MGNGECSNKVVDKQDKYQRIIDRTLKLADENGELIQENMIYASELDDIILKYLYGLDLESMKPIGVDEIIQRLGISRDKVFMCIDDRVGTKLVDLDELVRYIKYKEQSGYSLDIFISTYDTTENYEYKIDRAIGFRDREFLENCDCNLDSIERHITEYVVSNHIQITDFSICTSTNIGIIYEGTVDVINDIRNIIAYFVGLLRQQEDLLQDKIYNAALDELDDLFNYLVTDSEYRLCTNSTKRKGYKAKGKFRQLDKFENIDYMLDNKPVINTDRYLRYKDFYDLYDNIFDQAYSMIKWKEV